MKKWKEILCNIVITAMILVVFFFVSLAIHNIFHIQSLISPLFVLAVFLVSMSTNGYLYGIVAALISVLAVNFAFTFPYFAFNFTILENIIAAFILILVTVSTSALTTKIKKQEKMRHEAEKQKMRADLLRAVSHDLRTPLTTIYGSTSTIIENFNSLSVEKKLDILNGIQVDSKWLIRMVENLLSITKIDSDNVKLVKNAVVLEELVDSVLNKFKKNFPNQKVDLKMPEDFVVVAADALLIEQVLVNLLENAVYHAVGMTKLALNISVADTKVVFEVVDDGCGIEKEKLRNIFSGYYMNEVSIQDNQKKCMGIGLSVCAAIVKAHGQKIYAENTKEGGMCFGFTLELEEALYE